MRCPAGWNTSQNQDWKEKYQHLRYADNTTLAAESGKELKGLLIRKKEENENAGLKLNA